MNKLEFKYTFKECFEGTRNATRVYWQMSLLGGILILYTLYAYMKNGAQEGAITCWADEESFSQQTTNSDLKVKWPAIIKFRETRNLFLVYPSKQMCYLIPKRAFTDESQVKEFRELLDRKINHRR